jgi:hypothetical protein
VDRRRASGWIGLVLGVTVALVAACSGVAERTGASASAIAVEGRWRPSDAAAAAGEKVHVTYDDAPRWGSAPCGSGLSRGGAQLGSYLRDKFPALSSVGGFACRTNTADTSRMSIHGTGRALDLFIPKVGGAADNGRGDVIANWLILNAEQIGVQLVIWDRSIWRANGTNDGAYGGPHPHDDHLHVELNNEAGDAQTPWFLAMAKGSDPSVDVDEPPSSPAPTPTPAPARDSGVAAPIPEETVSPDDTPTADDAGASPPVEGTPAPHRDAGPGASGAGDAPGELDSLGGQPRRTLDDETLPSASCSAAPDRGPLTPGLSALGVAVALAALRRRRRAP